MFTSIIKELSGNKIAGCNKCCQTLIDDEYESSNIYIVSQNKIGSISGS